MEQESNLFSQIRGMDDIKNKVDALFAANDNALAKKLMYALVSYLHFCANKKEQSRVMLAYLLYYLWNENISEYVDKLLKKALKEGNYTEELYNMFKEATIDFATSKECASICYSKIGDISVEEYTKYIQEVIGYRMSKYDAVIYDWRAEKYLETEDYSLALADVNVAIALTPEQWDLYDFKGQLLRKLNGTDTIEEQIEWYSRAIELNPNYRPAYYHRGSAYLHMKDYKKAVFDLERFDDVIPNNDEGLKIKKELEKVKN